MIKTEVEFLLLGLSFLGSEMSFGAAVRIYCPADEPAVEFALQDIVLLGGDPNQ